MCVSFNSIVWCCTCVCASGWLWVPPSTCFYSILLAFCCLWGCCCSVTWQESIQWHYYYKWPKFIFLLLTYRCTLSWFAFYDELTTYRSITYENVQNGAFTSFWFDHWLPAGPLDITHNALFSHTTRPNVSVQCVFQTRFELCLRPRLTNAASTQLASLLSCLQRIQLCEEPDERQIKLTGKPYTSISAYAAIDSPQNSLDIHGQHIQSTRVPNKVKIFAWLYFKDSLSTCANLSLNMCWMTNSADDAPTILKTAIMSSSNVLALSFGRKLV